MKSNGLNQEGIATFDSWQDGIDEDKLLGLLSTSSIGQEG